MTHAETRTAPHTDPAATAVVLLGAKVDLQRSARAVRSLVDSIERSRYFPTLLVAAELQGHPVLDELRLAGVPVMVQRPLGVADGLAGRIRSLLELVSWLRSADARAVFVPSDERRLVRLVSVARKFARGVGEVVPVRLR